MNEIRKHQKTLISGRINGWKGLTPTTKTFHNFG